MAQVSRELAAECARHSSDARRGVRTKTAPNEASGYTGSILEVSDGLSPGGQHHELLRQTIESQIIPRLMLSKSAGDQIASPQCGSSRSICEHDIDAFVELLFQTEAEPALAFVTELGDAGVPRSTLLLELLAPTARRLGIMWEMDTCSFADVTIAMGRLQQSVHRLDRGHHTALAFDSIPDRQALFCPAAGEQHTFALSILDMVFRSAGWDVTVDHSGDLAANIRILKSRTIAVVGISISHNGALTEAASAIRQMRRASRNKSLFIMVGGTVINLRPEIASELGADATAADAAAAVSVAERSVLALSYSS